MNFFFYKKNFFLITLFLLSLSLFSNDISLLKDGKPVEEPLLDSNLLSALDGKDREGLSEDSEEIEIVNRLKNGELRKFVYEDEGVSLTSKDRAENLVVTSSSKEQLVRRTYKSDYRLIKKEIFNNPSSFNQLEKKSLTEYFYAEDGVLQRRKTEVFDENVQEETQFSPDGKPVLIEKYHYEEGEGKKKYSVKGSDLSFTYDTEGRLSLKKLTEYFEGVNRSGKKIITKKTRTYQYRYTSYTNPNTFFYENGVLREKLIYTTQTDFVQTFYFDEGFSVVNEFLDGIRVSEIVLLNGKELRRQSFEKD